VQQKIEVSSRYLRLAYLLLVLTIILLSLYSTNLSKAIFPTAVFGTTNNQNNNADRSPSFPNQEIIDPHVDWIDLENRTLTRQGDRSTDIESVDYSSDGKTLNATLWLYFPFKSNHSSSSNENVNYGMFIDADFDQTTGYGGIDYKVELSWDNQSKQWTQVLEKWSHYGEIKSLNNKTIPISSLPEEGTHYVTLSADLDAMLSPKKYKAIFYGEVKREGSYKTDFTRWVAIPPLELAVSASPNVVELRKGEQKTIEVKVNTTQGYEPTVNLFATSPSKNIIFDFTHNDTLNRPIFALRIPSYGIATTPLTISAIENASIGPYTLFVFANSSFPPEEFIKPKSFLAQESTTSFFPSSAISLENIFTQSSLLVKLQEPLTLVDNISDFWTKLGAPISFVYGIIAGISPWIFTKIKGRLNKREGNSKENSKK
jgi:hypothetical protein